MKNSNTSNNAVVHLQIDYSWPPLPSKSSSICCKKVIGCLGPKDAIVQTLKQRQWRYIIPPYPSINNWSLKFSGSVNLKVIITYYFFAIFYDFF